MYPVGIDDRLKKTPFVESLVLPHPLLLKGIDYRHHLVGVCIAPPLLYKALTSVSLCQDVKTLSKVFFPLHVGSREHVDRSFLARILSDRWPPVGAIGLVSCEFCVCSSCSSRGVR